jgi:polyferredoxin
MPHCSLTCVKAHERGVADTCLYRPPRTGRRDFRGTHDDAAPLRIVRPRTLLYAGLIALVGLIMLVAVLNRSTLQVNVLADRNPPFVLLSDGGIRNGYTVKILNKLHEQREFTLSIRGLPWARLAIVGMSADAPIRVTTDDLREVRVLIIVPAAGLAQLEGATKSFDLVVRDTASGHETARAAHFQRPSLGSDPAGQPPWPQPKSGGKP